MDQGGVIAGSFLAQTAACYPPSVALPVASAALGVLEVRGWQPSGLRFFLGLSLGFTCAAAEADSLEHPLLHTNPMRWVGSAGDGRDGFV